jgi:hypothetical protein
LDGNATRESSSVIKIAQIGQRPSKRLIQQQIHAV